jgi:hypothetical protein
MSSIEDILRSAGHHIRDSSEFHRENPYAELEAALTVPGNVVTYGKQWTPEQITAEYEALEAELDQGGLTANELLDITRRITVLRKRGAA